MIYEDKKSSFIYTVRIEIKSQKCQYHEIICEINSSLKNVLEIKSGIFNR